MSGAAVPPRVLLGGAPWTPLLLNPFLYWPASSYTVGGGTVSVFGDASGHAHPVSNATGAQQPTDHPGGIGVKESATFSGTTINLASQEAPSVWRFLHDGTDAYVSAIIKPTAGLLGPLWDTTGAASTSQVGSTLYIDGGLINVLIPNGVGGAAANAGSGGVVAVGVIQRIEYQYSGGFLDVWETHGGSTTHVFHNADSFAPAVGVDPSYTLEVGRFAAYAESLTAEMAEVVMLKRVPTGGELTSLATWLAPWGI